MTSNAVKAKNSAVLTSRSVIAVGLKVPSLFTDVEAIIPVTTAADRTSRYKCRFRVISEKALSFALDALSEICSLSKCAFLVLTLTNCKKY